MNTRKIASMLLAVALTCTVFAGCGSKADPATPGTEPAASTEGTAPSAEPSGADKTQFINIGIEAEPTQGLDPAKTANGVGAMLGFITEGIMRSDREMNIVPGIATGYDVNEDATKYTYTIRDGVLFHDGTPCDAEAIKWNYDRQIAGNADEEMYYANSVFGKVVSVEAPDKNTVIINLSEPDATLPYYLVVPNGFGLVSPTHHQKDPEGFKKNPVGAGPYKFVEWATESYIKLEANPHYYDGEVQNGGVNFRIIKEPAAMTSEFLAGGIDYFKFTNSSLPDVDVVEAQGFKTSNRPANGYGFICFADYDNNQYFKDIRVRQAIYHAIDREALVTGLFGGKLTVANSVIPPLMIGGDIAVTNYEYNPEKAKQLLAEAGYPDGFTFKYLGRSQPEHQATQTAVQAELKKIGIEMEIEVVQPAEFSTTLLTYPPNFDMNPLNWGAAANDPSYMATIFMSVSAKGGYNVSGFSNPEFDGLIEQAKKTPDAAKQAEMYGKAAQIFNDEAPIIFLAAQRDYWALSPKLNDPEDSIGWMSTNPWWKVTKSA